MTNGQLPALKGPSLTESVLALIDHHGLRGIDLHKKYGVNVSWLHKLRHGKNKTGNVEILQALYEELSGVPLIPSAPRPEQANRGA